MIEVAARELARPGPVVRLIRDERHGGGEGEPQEEDAEQPPDEVRRTLRRLGCDGRHGILNLPMPNRLASADSPYLQQHAENPVDW